MWENADEKNSKDGQVLYSEDDKGLNLGDKYAL